MRLERGRCSPRRSHPLSALRTPLTCSSDRASQVTAESGRELWHLLPLHGAQAVHAVIVQLILIVFGSPLAALGTPARSVFARAPAPLSTSPAWIALCRLSHSQRTTA